MITINIKMTKESKAIADVEDILDTFFREDYRYFEPKVYEHLSRTGYNSLDAKAIADYYLPLLTDLDQPEGYSRLSSSQKAAYVQFVKTIINDAKLFSSNIRTKARKPRKAKHRSAEQLAANVRFQAKDATLKLASVPPSHIVGANAVWLFNTRYRKITYLEGSLSIKGTTVIGFDEKKSFTKTIRKPAMISEILNKGYKVMLTEITNLKTRHLAATGRIGKDSIILRVIR